MTTSGIEDKLAAGEDLHSVPREELDRRAAEEARRHFDNPQYPLDTLKAIKAEGLRREGASI